MTVVLVDGTESPDGRIHLRHDDEALGAGLAVFETLRTYRRVPFRLDLHVERLRESAQWLGIVAPVAVVRDEIRRVVGRVEAESRVNVLLTAGGRRVVRAEPLDHARVGAPVRVASRRWQPDPWLPGWVKHTSRAGWVLAARTAQADEVLWIDASGAWTEATRSNLFVVRKGELFTPPDNGTILRGVTRAMILEAAHAAGIATHEDRVPVGPCDEMYLSSTLKELAPVGILDGAQGPGAGPIGRQVHEALRRLTADLTAGEPA